MRRPILAVALSLTVASPASALSCLQPDIARSTLDAVRSQDSYRIVLGRMSYRAVTPPAEGTPGEAGRALSIPARFTGRALTAEGFTDDTQDDIILNITCVMQSCGSVEPNTRVLAFLRREGDKAVLDLDPCSQWLFPDPTEEQLETVRACVTGGDCPAD